MAGRPRQFDDEEVFAAIAAIVSSGGPSAVTLAAVADVVGATAPAVRSRFGSKRGLLVAYAARQPAAVASVFEAASARASSPSSAIVEALVGLAEPVADRGALANHLAMLQLDLADPALAAHATAHARAVRRELAALVDAARARGELGGAQTAAIVDTLVVTYQGALVTWAVEGRGSLRAWLRRRLCQCIRGHQSSSGARAS